MSVGRQGHKASGVHACTHNTHGWSRKQPRPRKLMLERGVRETPVPYLLPGSPPCMILPQPWKNQG